MLAQNQTLRAYLTTEDYLKLAKVVFDEEIHHRVLVVGPKRNGKINEHRELVGAVEQR